MSATTILIVDDEELFHEYVEAFLDIKNAHFLHAYNGKEGLKLYLEHEPSLSLVILDITMPVMNGEEFLRELNVKRRAICPIIVLSGWFTEKEKASCMTLGAKEVLAKPISPDKLRPCVKYHLEAEKAPGRASGCFS